MRIINPIALILVIVGALNWGLWGFFQFDLVAWLFQGNATNASRVVYALVGLAGVWSLGLLGKCKDLCCTSHCDSSPKESNKHTGGCCRG